MEIFFYIVICSFIASLFIKGFVDKFVEEDKNLEGFYKDIEENKDIYSTEEIRKKYIEKRAESRVRLNTKFSVPVFLCTLVAYVLLFIFKENYISYFVNVFLISLLIISMFADIKACIIPDEVNLVGFIGGIIYTFFNLTQDIQKGFDLILGGLSGSIIFILIGALGYLLYKKEGMGGGDIKMMGVIGLFMGFKNTIQIFILSFFVGAIISIFLLVTKIKKKDDYIPFGPFIVISTYFTMFFPAWYVYNQIYRFLMYNL